ncbi:uncharacterized protein LOC115572507 isoform X1 [Sparus aurata]|uniref:uncharacterized protein LOC115572507 isoform X1 n=1 Tax=Sparus aurata TaxID=8175 RepID=UPI0011C13C04|nr:uncharacterized protein LOC115572507 isoform X1 [Sparus aurata]
MILQHHLDSFISADTFNSTQVFVLLFLTVGRNDYLAFLSGTKLFVTVSRITLNAVQCWKLLLTVSMCVCAACCCCQASDEQVVKPVVSVYPAASRAPLEGRSSLLCVASAMFPPLVRFSWERQKEDQVESLPAEGEQLELSESGCTATILPLDQDALDTYKYRCSVQHEGGTVEAQTEQAAVQTTSRSITTTSSAPPPTSIVTQPAAGSFQSQCRVKLLCVLYTVLIVKSLVYCCGLSLLRIL